MPKITRVTDTTRGTCNIGADCCPHSRNGINTEGLDNAFFNNLKIHLMTQKGNCRCPHGGTYKTVEGSSNSFFGGLKVTFIGHSTQCTSCGQSGTHVSGSPNSFFN